MAQYLKEKIHTAYKENFQSFKKVIGEQHLWQRGYFCSTVGAVTEEQIKKYIENQADDPGSFKIWDECKEEAVQAELKLNLSD